MVNQARILVVADLPENASLLRTLFEQGGFEVTLAEQAVAPPPCEMVVVDVTRTRFSPLADLQAQRRMGCSAPAIVVATRVTDQMAAEMFSLGIRDFVLKPIEDSALLERVKQFMASAETTSAPATRVDDSLVETERALARRLEEMNILSRIGRVIASLTSIDTMLSHIVDAAVFLTHAEEGAIFLADETTGELVLRAEKGFGQKQSEIIRQPSSDSDAVHVFQTGQPVMKGGETEHKVKTGYLVRALINVPIISGRTVAGVIAVYNHGDRSFDAMDLALLTNLADYAALAFDKVEAIKRVEASMGEKLGASREIALHAETLLAPIEGIDSLVSTLLAGQFGPLNEQQQHAVRRIHQATVRVNEIVEFIRQAAASAEAARLGR